MHRYRIYLITGITLTSIYMYIYIYVSCVCLFIYKLHFANGFFVGWITVSIEEPTTIVNELGTEGGEKYY